MNHQPQPAGGAPDIFQHADLYDRSINWDARLAREIPTLCEVFGPPRSGGILDAGCGPGRQACALAARGYRVVAADISQTALELARARAAEAGIPTMPPDVASTDSPQEAQIAFIHAGYTDLSTSTNGGFDGAYCIGNSLAASGTRDTAREAIRQFGLCLRPGGRLFIQILNFAPMRQQIPCVKGPRVVSVDGIEYISTRQFHFHEDHVQVTNVTLWHENEWKHHAHAGRLYPISMDEMNEWCAATDLHIDERWGGYDRSPFDIDRSVDLIVIATRN
jgi:glycine/sarcosine N-methyltransferase